MLPSDVIKTRVTWGNAQLFTGVPVETKVTLTPSHTIIHAGSGIPLVNLLSVTNTQPGTLGYVDLPVVDQPGFIDIAGDAITGWFYTFESVYYSGDRKITLTRHIQPVTGNSEVDLDLVPTDGDVEPPVIHVVGVTSVNGQTGDVVLDANSVGADVAGSAQDALTNAMIYTDGEISSLEQSISQNVVTSFNGHTGDVVADAVSIGADVAGSASNALLSANLYTDEEIDTLQASILSSVVTSVNGQTGGINLTKRDLGLGSVDNTADVNKPVSNPQQLALDEKADLVNGVVPQSQLPSYVDDVLEFPTQGDFPTTGESGKVYIAGDVNQTFRWTGSGYTRLSEGVALGETSSTAYRGDRGALAYAHTLDTANPHGVTKAQVGLGNVDNTADINKPISTATQSALDSKLPTTERSVLTTVVSHGSNALTARPTGYALVIWRGSVEPTNKIVGDIWVEVP